MRAKRDLELLVAVWWLMRFAIEFYTARALRSIRAQEISDRDI
jgi:hypothetical protein